MAKIVTPDGLEIDDNEGVIIEDLEGFGADGYDANNHRDWPEKISGTNISVGDFRLFMWEVTSPGGGPLPRG